MAMSIAGDLRSGGRYDYEDLKALDIPLKECDVNLKRLWEELEKLAIQLKMDIPPEDKMLPGGYEAINYMKPCNALGIKTKEGFVLAAERPAPFPCVSLVQEPSSDVITAFDEHRGCVISQSYSKVSGSFGLALLVAGHDEKGPNLWYQDPSGFSVQCSAKAIGINSAVADKMLLEYLIKDLTLLEAETLALSVLKRVMKEEVTPNTVDIAKVAPTYRLYSPFEVEAVIRRL